MNQDEFETTQLSTYRDHEPIASTFKIKKDRPASSKNKESNKDNHIGYK